MLCGGKATAYKWLLERYGIPARIATLATKNFIEGYERYDTHVTVEVFDSGRNKWIVSDPTFNSSFQCNGDGNLLDLEQLRHCSQSGGIVSAFENGGFYINGRRVNDYYLTYSDLLFGAGSKIKCNTLIRCCDEETIRTS